MAFTLTLQQIFVMHLRLLFIFMFIVFALPTNAQIFKGYLAGGINLAQVDGDEAYGYKMPGANFGVGVMMPFKKRWDVSLETAFSQKGANQKAQYAQDSLNGAYKLRLNYFEIPVMIHYTDKDFITVGTGASWSRLIDATEWEHGKLTETNALNGVYKPYDISVLVDLRMRIYKRLKFNFRYAYSTVKIRTRSFTNIGGTSAWTRHQYNNVLSFRLIYMFNEDQSARSQKQAQLENQGL